MTEADKAFCVSWIKAHARKWQVLNRSQWKYQFHEKTLVRFVEEVQLREDEVPLLLEYLASDDCIPTLCLYDQAISPEWKPTRAWLELSNKSVGNVHSVRLYHGLMTELSALGDGPYLVENGCVSKVYFTYYWNQASVQTVPASTSGVSYRISGLTRDRDTGLYTYAIEKRERVQQDVAEYFTGKTVYSDFSEEYHLGVRQDRVGSTGKQASVGNGRLVRRKISKNSDCTSDVHNTIEQEKAVPQASVTVHKGLTGTTVTTHNRNMVDKAPVINLSIGDSVENTETEGGRWNQTIRTVVQNALDWISGSCRKTVFHHSHHDTKVQSEDPGFTHVEEAGDGKVTEVDVSVTSDGAYQVSEKTTQEIAVPGASETIHKGLAGTTRTVSNRNMPTKMTAGDLAIGESVENSETDGGRWNQTVRRVIRTAVTKIADSCGKTIFHHKHSTSRVQGTDPGFTHVEEAQGGRIVRKSSSVTSDGSYRVEEDVTTEKPVVQSTRSAHMTLRGLTVRVENRHQQNPLPDPTRVGESVTNTKTDGGLYNTVHVEEGRTPAGKISDSCTRNAFTHQHSQTRNESELADPEHDFEVGKIVSKSGHLTGNGTADNTETVSEAVPQTLEYQYRRADDSIVHVVKYHNLPVGYFSSHPELNGADGLSVSDSLNAFKLHDGQVSWVANSRWKLWWSDRKFIKHGRTIDFYDVQYNKRLHKFCHLKWSVQLHWIRGDAYTDYVADLMRADPDRTTPGVMWVQLVGRYNDGEGNELAEWKWIELAQREGGADVWHQCDSTCKALHDFKVTDRSIVREKLRQLLHAEAANGGGLDDSKQRTGSIVEAIKGLPVAMAAAATGSTENQIREHMAIAAQNEVEAKRAAEEAKAAEKGGK